MQSTVGLVKTECLAPPPSATGPYKTLTDVECTTAARVDW
jgi:hypothetical protein